MADPAADRGVRSLGRPDWSTWPKCEAATEGFRNYWYPVTWSRKVTPKPIQVTAADETIILIRDAGVVRALHHRCPRRRTGCGARHRGADPGLGLRVHGGRRALAQWEHPEEHDRLVTDFLLARGVAET